MRLAFLQREAMTGRDLAAPARTRRRPEPVAPHPAAQIASLKHRLGNQAMLRMLQRKPLVSEPGDAYEREADRIAQQVTAAPGAAAASIPAAGSQARSPAALQRACSCGGACAECQEEERQPLQRKADTETSSFHSGAGMPPVVQDVLRSPGRPLDPATRSFFESRFGQNFGGVRLHSDSRAAQSAMAVGARAYTAGGNIVFGAGEFAPATPDGRKLLAHELTHVVQQAGFSGRQGIFRQPIAGGAAAQEDVWGFRVDKSMCGCIPDVRNKIGWARRVRAAYLSCIDPEFTSGADVLKCVRKQLPPTKVAGTTSASGCITTEPIPPGPCGPIAHHATLVHETFHRRDANRLAEVMGPDFLAEWNKIGPVCDRLDKLAKKFPTDVAIFEVAWGDALAAVMGESEAYKWGRRFLDDVVAALERLCGASAAAGHS